MFVIALVGLFACVGAAPRHQGHLSPFDGSLERYLNQQMFDTNRFWDEFSTNLNREMEQLNTMLSGLHNHFPAMSSSEGIEGNQYKIMIPLSGFNEKDIIVKARQGMLMIQAVHEGQNSNSYLNVRSLPACVGEQGSWSYENDVLKIVFPVTHGGDSGTEDLTPDVATPVPNRSREETESPIVGEQSGDIDEMGRGDKDKEIKTNEIPSVEATTYAVDVKGDVEFVPVRY